MKYPAPPGVSSDRPEAVRRPASGTPLELSLAIGDYAHVAPIVTGDVPIEGVRPTVVRLAHAELFRRAIRQLEFDITELSLASHILGVAGSEGQWPFVGLPIFTSRAFRHSMVFVNARSGIAGPGDLRGKRVGVPEFHMTAVLFARGFLADDYGVRVEDIRWVQGGHLRPGRAERMPLDLPDGVDLVVERERSLEDMLVAGDLDAVMGPYVPQAFREDPGGVVRRLFDDPEQAERDWYARTGIFPIMHLVAMRRDVHEGHPWLAAALLEAFEEAKRVAVARLEFEGASHVCLPWTKYEVARVRREFGQEFWPYGLEPNRRVLEAATRYAREQGLVRHAPAVEALFVPGVR